MLTRRLGLLLALSLPAVPALGHEFNLGPLHIHHPWARATVASAQAGAAFMEITNRGTAADRLLAARSPVASTVELHNHIMDGNVMRMREVAAIDLPAGASVDLKPGGLHVMLFGLQRQLKEGESFPLTLRFEKAGEIVVEVTVEKLAGPGHDQHRH